jgi:DNA helicase II / ATP-dependent DNA helicase PcrA
VFPGTQIVRLERNYRSTQAILDVASAVVSNNRGRLGKTLWTEKPGGEPPQVICLQDQEEEAEFCARLVQDDSPGSTAILYRMNAQSLHFENHFTRRGIRYRLVGTVRFYAREEVKDALAYLSLLLNARDEVSFRRIANKPGRGLGAASVEKIVAEWKGNGGTLLDACRRLTPRLGPKARAGLSVFLSCLSELSGRLSDTPLPELARAVLLRTGLHELYTTRERADGVDRVANLETMVSDMASYESGTAGLEKYLEAVALASPLDVSADAAADARVTLITLHNTKGLEFDRVIITGLEEGIFPHDSSSAATEDLEEERRLFYVGITRARERLLLTWCLNRRIFGRTTEMAPSRFIDEIPSQSVVTLGGEAEDEEEQFSVGAGVFHEEYGTGVVERKWYSEGSLLVQVRFTSGRVAKFLPKYARLERVSLDD